MMKFVLLAYLLILTSCSGGSSDGKVVKGGLSTDQVKAQNMISQDVQSLNQKQYNITTSDLEVLEEESLITQDELNSLTVVK